MDDHQVSAARVESRPLSSAIAGVGLVDSAALAGRPERAPRGWVTETVAGTRKMAGLLSWRIGRDLLSSGTHGVPVINRGA
jgi:hypothetical protein